MGSTVEQNGVEPQRVDFGKASPEGYKAMVNLETVIRSSGIDRKLLHLIKIRASQLNGCAFCIDMHTKDARADGETEQRIYELNAWREAPFYSEKERAVLAWTEALTNIQQGHAPADVYREFSAQFTPAEQANITLAITTINVWNRLAIGSRMPPGHYQPAGH